MKSEEESSGTNRCCFGPLKDLGPITNQAQMQHLAVYSQNTPSPRERGRGGWGWVLEATETSSNGL